MNSKVTNPAVQAGLITQETLEALESLQQCQDETYANSTPLDRILAAEIERLEKNYGFSNRFILIGLGDGGQLSMYTTPMTKVSKEHMLDRAKMLP